MWRDVLKPVAPEKLMSVVRRTLEHPERLTIGERKEA